MEIVGIARTRLPSMGGLALALVAVFISGCGSGDGLDRHAISGSVQFDGKPLAKGQIQFFPSAPSEVAVATGGSIVGGKYSIPKADGLVAGTYKVMISSEGEAPTKGKKSAAEPIGDMPGLGPLNAEELIPIKYNSKSELTATVKNDGPNTFDFTLTK